MSDRWRISLFHQGIAAAEIVDPWGSSDRRSIDELRYVSPAGNSFYTYVDQRDGFVQEQYDLGLLTIEESITTSLALIERFWALAGEKMLVGDFMAELENVDWSKYFQDREADLPDGVPGVCEPCVFGVRSEKMTRGGKRFDGYQIESRGAFSLATRYLSVEDWR